jgi:curli biogenesis system outer membrane secretion channel CsgG
LEIAVRALPAIALAALSLAGCAGDSVYSRQGVRPTLGLPVTNNDTPYSQCLTMLSKVPGTTLPVFTVGEVADKTGQVDRSNNGAVLSQGITEMMMSAFYKTRRVNLVERFDLRIPLAEARMVEQKLAVAPAQTAAPIRVSNFVVMGALTELNYNIVSEGARLSIGGVGGGARTVVINVGLDVRVVNSQSFDVRYVSSLQKQIFGYEVEANVFRFFGSRLVEFDAGRIQNEPLQLGVRSVVEMAVYQIMTDYLGLPSSPECQLERTTYAEESLPKPKGK